MKMYYMHNDLVGSVYDVCVYPVHMPHMCLQVAPFSMFGKTLEDVMVLQRANSQEHPLPWIITVLTNAVLALKRPQVDGLFRYHNCDNTYIVFLTFNPLGEAVILSPLVNQDSYCIVNIATLKVKCQVLLNKPLVLHDLCRWCVTRLEFYIY